MSEPVAKLTTEPPSHLTEHAREIWRATIAEIEADGREMDVLNREAMIGFCEAAAMVRESGEVIAAEGYLIDGGRDGKRRHPALSVRLGALSALKGFAVELGLTPASSGKLPRRDLRKVPRI